MGIAESLDARARAMRSVFEETRQKHLLRRPAQKRNVDKTQLGWNTSVGPQAMRTIFEQMPQGSAAKRRAGESRFGWNTSVGPQAIRAVFEPLLGPAGQKEHSRIADKTEQELLLGQPAQSRIPLVPRQQTALKGRHASVINELIKAHRLF